jgi:hypothetical protein
MDNNGGTQVLSKVNRIEDRIDKAAISETTISSASGGMAFRNMLEVMEFAKMMAISDIAMPKHLRGNVGACLAVCIQAIEWKMSPIAVANKSYVVNDRISYESQLIHAVIEQRAPLVGRLRCSYSGQGGSRRCKVWATAKGETAPFEYESATFDMIQPKNSPLWKSKPDLQLFYNASRDFARMYFPDVILGVYAEDELEPSTIVASRPAVAMPRAIGEAPTQTVAPDPEAHEQPAEEPAIQQEPQVEPEAQASPEPTGFEKFKIELWELAESLGCKREDFDKTLSAWVLKLGKKGKEDQVDPKLLAACSDALANKAGIWAFVK